MKDFLLIQTLKKEEGRPIFKKRTFTTTSRKLMDNVIIQVILCSILLMSAREISTYIWTKIN